MSSSNAREVTIETGKYQRVAEPDAGAGSRAPAGSTRQALRGERAAPGLSAVVVVHGMGQQLPFETLDAVVEGLLEMDARSRTDPSSDVSRAEPDRAASSRAERERLRERLQRAGEAAGATVRVARVGGMDLSRAELTLGAGTDAARRVHLYECYWAPLTEGEVSLADVMRFLWGAAWNGLRNTSAKDGFFRFMFDKWCRFAPQKRARWQLLLAAVVLGALTVLNLAAAALFAASVLGRGSEWVRELVPAGTAVVGGALVLAIIVTPLMLGLRKMWLFFVLLFDVAAAALALVFLGMLRLAGIYILFPGSSLLASPWVNGLFWALVFLAMLVVRRLLVQYVGDVAVYVSPHALDRFYELRQKIKQAVRDVAQAVYRDRGADRALTYERIAIVGHSLGSVAAYDALNALINLDALDPSKAVGVLERTCLLLTFGSPLNKTAFIFGDQGHRTGQTREALAAAVQPMIQDYVYRRFPWINVHSPADIISGELFLYDDPKMEKSDPRHVDDVIDTGARTPLLAHTEYWKSSVVFERLREALLRTAADPS